MKGSVTTGCRLLVIRLSARGHGCLCALSLLAHDVAIEGIVDFRLAHQVCHDSRIIFQIAGKPWGDSWYLGQMEKIPVNWVQKFHGSVKSIRPWIGKAKGLHSSQMNLGNTFFPADSPPGFSCLCWVRQNAGAVNQQQGRTVDADVALIFQDGRTSLINLSSFSGKYTCSMGVSFS